MATSLYEFKVINEGYHLIQSSLKEANKNFLNNYDPTFFTDDLDIENSTTLSINQKLKIRQKYFQSLESLFGFTFAFIQAPHALFAWLDKYQTKDLRNLCKSILAQKTNMT
jgi:hypothetical protein